MSANILVDYEYYSAFTGDSIDEAMFNKLNTQSQFIILKGVIHRDYDCVIGMDEDIVTDVKNAICAQISYMNENGGLSMLSGNNSSLLTSENYGGSYSYSKQENKAYDFIKYVNGIAIAPMVYIHLQNTGLLYAGVDLNYEP